MRVSIVITHHNCERFVSQAVESALAQTHPDTEVIVIDDGSTDGSRRLLERYRARARVMMNDWAGQGATVNAGFAASTGSAVIFLDPDDVLLSTAAAEAARVLEDPRVANVQWPLLEGDESATPTGELHPKQPLDEGDLCDRLWTCPHYVSPPQSGNAYARWYLEQVLPMPERPFPAGADSYLYQLVIPFGEVRTIPEPQSIYRRHPGSVSAQPLDARVARWARLDEAAWGRLAFECEQRGLPAEVSTWKRNSWNHKLMRTITDLDEYLGTETPYLLIDDNGSFGLYGDETRKAIQWWGIPADGASACAEAERYRREGIRYLVIGWPAFWWLAYFGEFRTHLANYRVVLANPCMRIYDLEQPALPSAKRAGRSSLPLVPVVMCTYRRPERLESTLATLVEQERCRLQLHVWNNNRDIADVVDAALSQAPELRPQVHHSSENIGGFGRFRIAAELSSDFPAVVFIDDDVDCAPDAVATLIDELRPGSITSFYAFALLSDRDYFARRELGAGEQADYCGTGGMACDTSIFRDSRVFSCPERFWFIEDLWLSYYASHHKRWRLSKSAAAFHLNSDERDLWVKVSDRKNEFLRYLLALGWQPHGRRHTINSVDGPSRSTAVSISSSG